jgi:hypothetical protein
MGMEMTPEPDIRTRLADFAAREAERLNTPEMPDFGRSDRATWPAGWEGADA